MGGGRNLPTISCLMGVQMKVALSLGFVFLGMGIFLMADMALDRLPIREIQMHSLSQDAIVTASVALIGLFAMFVGFLSLILEGRR